MLTRRRFCWLAGSVCGAAATSGRLAIGQSPQRQLRVIAYNVYKCTGWPGNRPLAQQAVKRGQMPRRLADELALYEPDVINFSESPEEPVVKEIAERLGMNYVYFPSGQNWPTVGATSIGILGIIDRVEDRRTADLYVSFD